MKIKYMRLFGLMLSMIVLASAIVGCAASTSTPAPATISVPSPTSTPPHGCDVHRVEITEVNWFREPDGAWRVVGMMQNNSGQPITKLTMGVLTKNKNDELVYPEGPKGETVSAFPFHLLPGDRAPISVWIKREIPTLDHFSIEKKFCVVAESAERMQLQERRGQLSVDDNGLAQVTAEVVNPGPQTAMVNGMMVAVFDASGSLLSAFDAHVTPRILAPGESGPVRATLALPPDSATRVESYKLYMDAIVTEPVPELLDAQRDVQVTSQYLDAAGRFHLVGQITNSGTRPIMVSVQATLYADQARSAVVDAASVDTLIPLAPGASLPFDLTDWRVLNGTAGLWDALSKQGAAVELRIEPFRTWTTDTSVAPLTVIPEQPVFSGQEVVFSGAVKNETGHTVVLGTVTIVLRDKTSGKIIATGQEAVDILDALTNGEARGYLIEIPLGSGFDPQTMDVEITASGQQT